VLSEKRKVQETSDGTYRTIFENLPFVAFTLDRDGRLLEANKYTEKLFGSSVNDFAGKKFSEIGLLSKGDLLKAFTEFRKNLQGRVTQKTVYKLKLRTGNKILLELIGIPLKEGGVVTRVLDVGRDITGLKKSEEEFEAIEERYKVQFDQALDAIFIADAETGIIVDCNLAATKLVDMDKSEIIGQKQSILHPPEQTSGKFSETFMRHMKEDEGKTIETKVITKSGKLKDVAIRANLIELKDKKFLLGTFRDITEQKKSEEAVKKKTTELERFSRLSVGREIRMVELKKRIRELENLLKSHGIEEKAARTKEEPKEEDV